MEELEIMKKNLIAEIKRRNKDKIIETTNAQVLIKLINSAESINEAITIAQLGTTYKRTGFHFDPRAEKMTNTIKYLKRNEVLSFKSTNKENINMHKLIIGDNYDALLNLLIEYRDKIDVIYIDPPYSKNKMGDFAVVNYENNLTRDNLLSMLYPRLLLAKELLNKEDGVIFCSIDDKNQAYLKCLFDEVFEESNFLFVAPRITKKSGKTTTTIQKNHDYILGYAMSHNDICFSQEELNDESYNLEDEYVEQRGKYKVSQCLDYDSLSYSSSLDYEIEIDNHKFYPGGNFENYNRRKKGEHKQYDWTWRWQKSKFEFGLKNGFIVIKNGKDGNPRIYTKTYLKCKIGKKSNNEFELIYTDKATKPFTTLNYIDNKYSNDNAKKELDSIFNNSNELFKNPKPSKLIEDLIKMVCTKKDAIILDFFAGSGTTGQAVLNLNKEDSGSRKFILCTNNELSEYNPNGIALDVTSKRLKRIMTGACYDNSKDFKLSKENFKPYGDSLNVYDIKTVANHENTDGKTPFDVIDETDYDLPKLGIKEKIDWICCNFEITQKDVEKEEEWKKRMEVK